MSTDTLTTYVVTLSTPAGLAAMDVPSNLGPEAAGRRAFWTAAAIGWGDLPDLSIDSIVPLDEYERLLADEQPGPDDCGGCDNGCCGDENGTGICCGACNLEETR